MIYLLAQPNELYFVWQCQVQLENFKDMNVVMKDVHYLVSYDTLSPIHPMWQVLVDTYGCNVHCYPDERKSRQYSPSIRPHLISKFCKEFPELIRDYIFYMDCDVLFEKEPMWEGMTDGRWHITPDIHHYISVEYIKSKHSPSLLRDMLNVVGIDEETATKGDIIAGGIHYFIPHTTPEFWDEVEEKCEIMYPMVYSDRRAVYMQEYYDIFYKNSEGALPFEEYVKLEVGAKNRYDFQIWCADLFVIHWMTLKYGIPVYCNPNLDFDWPTTFLEGAWGNKLLFHNSGAVEANRNDVMIKQDYKNGTTFDTPFVDPSIDHLGYVTVPQTGERKPVMQLKYLEIIKRLRPQFVQTVAPIAQTNTGLVAFDTTLTVRIGSKVSCVMITYGRHSTVERSIACWLLQTWEDKELIIYNTAIEHPYALAEELKGKGIRVINNNTDHVTNKPYDNVGAIRRDALVYAEGDWYVCWDDDDLYLPWHITQGMKYLGEHPNMKAYMPMYSFWRESEEKGFEYAKNSMEASCIVDIKEVRQYGFANSNGAEHLTWRHGLRDRGLLDEKYDVRPLESYAYVWGETASPHKQSGHILDPNNFENHKAASLDFGSGLLGLYGYEKLIDWFFKLNEFVRDRKFFTALLQSLRK